MGTSRQATQAKKTAAREAAEGNGACPRCESDRVYPAGGSPPNLACFNCGCVFAADDEDDDA